VITVRHNLNYYLTGLIRLLQGLCAVGSSFEFCCFQWNLWICEFEGCAFPSSHGILANWCPPSERGRIGGFIYSGKLKSNSIEW